MCPIHTNVLHYANSLGVLTLHILRASNQVSERKLDKYTTIGDTVRKKNRFYLAKRWETFKND